MSSIVDDIYEVFKNYYTEDKVDLQTEIDSGTQLNDIIIYWPEVEVKNEYDDSVIIWKLFCKISITDDGHLYGVPRFNRSEYNKEQWNSNYMHSHISSIPKNHISEFQASCLGTGPIKQTIRKLSSEHHRDLDVWRLFVWELDKYVHVESVSGIPYHRLKTIGVNPYEDQEVTSLQAITALPTSAIKDLLVEFMKYYIPKCNLPFNYHNGVYSIGLSFTEKLLRISNAFIDWYNSDKSVRDRFNKELLTSCNMIEEVYLFSNSVIYKRGGNYGYRDCPLIASLGEKVLTFKGVDILLTSNGELNVPDNITYILNRDIISYILYKILRFINFKYGKPETRTSARTRVL